MGKWIRWGRLFLAMALGMALAACSFYGSVATAAGNSGKFYNPIKNIGNDPFVAQKDGYYYLIESWDGTRTILRDFANDDDQLWQVVDNGDGYARILNKKSGRALSVNGVRHGQRDAAPPVGLSWRIRRPGLDDRARSVRIAAIP